MSHVDGGVCLGSVTFIVLCAARAKIVEVPLLTNEFKCWSGTDKRIKLCSCLFLSWAESFSVIAN